MMIPTIPTPDEILDKGFSRGKKQADLLRSQKIPKHLKGKRIEEEPILLDEAYLAELEEILLNAINDLLNNKED